MPEPLGDFFTWLESVANETLENITKWANRYLWGPWSRRDTSDDAVLGGFADGFTRIIFGEVKTGHSSIEGDEFDPDDKDDGFNPTSSNTRPRTFIEWWDAVVVPTLTGFKDWILGGLGDAFSSVETWWNGVGAAYDRGNDPLDGMARAVFGEKRKTDGTQIPISGFIPTKTNTEARSVSDHPRMPWG